MPRYIVTYANSTGRIQTMITGGFRTVGSYGVIGCWEVSDDGLTVTKYEEPERLFAYSYPAGGISAPQTASAFRFPSACAWYELIDGNYIRLTDEQVTELREADHQSK